MPHKTTVAEPISASPRTGERTSGSLFPQRFTPFEYYYYVEHRPGYPSVFPIRLECHGTLERGIFEQAFAETHARHPFLSARIEHDPAGWPMWVAGEAAPIAWVDGTTSASDNVLGTPQPHGLRLLVRRDGDKTVMVFRFPHVAVDGMGAFGFIADLMVAYAHRYHGEEGDPPWGKLDPALLADRGGHSLFSARVKLADLLRAMRVSTPLLLRRAAVVGLHESQPDAASVRDEPDDFLVHTLSQQETAALSRIARGLEVRLHDLLMRDYYLMLADWNQSTPEARRPIRLLVPINVRRKKDYRMPAANVFSYAFLTRRGRDCRQRDELLKWIRSEMATVKRARRGLSYELGLRMMCIVPRLLRWNLRRKWPFATAVFSNLNAGFDHVPLPWRDGRRVAGELVFENGYGIGPIRPETRVCCAVHSYARRMSICFRCDPQYFAPDQRRALLDAYLARLRETVDVGS